MSAAAQIHRFACRRLQILSVHLDVLYLSCGNKRNEDCNLIQHPNVERLQREEGLRTDKTAVHVNSAAILLIGTEGSAAWVL